MREQITLAPAEVGGDTVVSPEAVYTEAVNLDEGALAKDGVGLYLEQISKYPLLTAEQEVELAKTIEAGTTAEILLALRDPATREGARESLLESLENKTRAMRRTGKGEVRPDRSVTTEEGRLQVAAAWEEKALQYSDEDVEDLAYLVELGQQAKTTFINSNLRLTVSIAKRYNKSKLPLLDVIQNGNVGLIRGVEKFDYTRGYKFSTYATWWIKQAITREMANTQETIRLPVHIHDEVQKLRRTEGRFYQQHEREPTNEELAALMKTTPDRVGELREWSRSVASLNAPVDKSDVAGAELQELLADPDDVDVHTQVVSGWLGEELEGVLTFLNEREAHIIRMRFGLADGKEHTLTEIGDGIGLTRERVRQIQNRALEKLRMYAPGHLEQHRPA